jgi:PqqD family protein of HPr-rel-A system
MSPLPTPMTTITARPSDSEVWRLPEGVSLLWRSWDADEIVVFNCASGQTHLLDAFSAAVLQQIEAAPSTMTAMLGQLGAQLGLETEAVARRLAGVCSRLEHLGLAEPRAP